MCTVEELIRQKSPSYQHMEGTCFCNECLCGQCRCKIERPPLDFPKRARSNYQREFFWKHQTPEKPFTTQEYRERNSRMFMKTTYQRLFDAKKIQHTFSIPSRQPNNSNDKINQSMEFETSYGTAYSAKKTQKTFSLKPIEVQRGIFRSPFRCRSTYKSDYRGEAREVRYSTIERSSEDQEQQTINQQERFPNPYLKTSYQHFYQSLPHNELSCTQPCVPQKNQPFMPTSEIGSWANSHYRLQFVSKKAQKCRARQMMEGLLKS